MGKIPTNHDESLKGSDQMAPFLENSGREFQASGVDFSRRNTAHRARAVVEVREKYRLAGPRNIQALPQLMDDEDEDFQLKSQIVDHLNSAMGTMSTFYDLIVFTSNICFNKGINQARLTRFFESEQILKLLLQKVFNEEASKCSVPSRGRFGLEPAKKHIKTEDKSDKKKIDEETLKDLEIKLQTFRQEYKPEDSYTFAVFLGRLKEKYKDYDLNPWLESKTQFFMEMLRGYKMDEITGVQHIKNMVHGAYTEKTKHNNLHEEFIRTHFSDFFHVIPRGQETGNKPCFIIKLNGLNNFFRRLKGIKTRETGEGQMIDIITRICFEEIQKHADSKNGIVIVVQKDATSKTITVENPKYIRGELTEIIDEAIKVSSPHINTQNLLVNPDGTPERIISEYERIFDNDGEINNREYNAMLRSIFEHREEYQQKGERIEAIKRRLKEIFEEVNATLLDIYKNAEAEMSQEIKDILDINDYSELIKIARTEKDKKKRYAARLKTELTWVVYRGKSMPRFTFRESDSRKVKAKMEATSEDIRVDHDQPVKIIKFIDNEDGNVEPIDETKENHEDNGAQIGEIRLIPAKFAGQDCHLLHNGEENAQREYINIKSLRSLIVNRIRERSMAFEDVTDMIRMTFVVDDMEELRAMKEKINISHASLGRLIEVEDTYTDTQENNMGFIGHNESKSKKYRTLKYVSYVPIFADDKLYIVQFEMRVLLLEDAIREKSKYHEIGHKAYEKRRSTACIPVLEPRVIFPEKYEEEINPDSLSGRVRIKLRKALASTVSLESQDPKTPQASSLPASL